MWMGYGVACFVQDLLVRKIHPHAHYPAIGNMELKPARTMAPRHQFGAAWGWEQIVSFQRCG